MRLSLICLLLLALVPWVRSAKKRNYLLNKPNCTATAQSRIERVVAKAMTIGPHGRKFPETFPQVRTYCRDSSRYVATVERFIKSCYEKTVADMANLILYTIKASLRKYCTKKKSKLVRDLLHLGPCANKYIQPNDRCVQVFTNKTQEIFELADDRKKINYVCCYYVDLIHCMEDFMESIKCMRSSMDIIMDYFRTIQGNLQETVCGEYTDATDACQRLGPPVLLRKPKLRYYPTPMFTIIDLIESMETFVSPI